MDAIILAEAIVTEERAAYVATPQLIKGIKQFAFIIRILVRDFAAFRRIDLIQPRQHSAQ
ncbi:hypothetical protein D3C72_1883020 [compost metagenome]